MTEEILGEILKVSKLGGKIEETNFRAIFKIWKEKKKEEDYIRHD